MTFLTISMSTEDSMEVVCRCFDSLRELIDNLGRYFLTDDLLTEILDSMRVVLDGESMCQISPDDDGLSGEEEEGEEEDDEDEFEHDSKLLGYLSECLSALCKVLKEEMGPHFDTYIKESLGRRSRDTCSMDEKM